MVYVRNLTRDDYDYLLDMIYESIHILENKPSKQTLLNSPDIKKYYEDWGRNGDKALMAISEDNHPLGAVWYRLFSENNKGYGYLNHHTPECGIAVSKEVRGMGVGTLLMRKIIEDAKQEGHHALSLSVDPANYSAVQLYRKLGFEEVGISGTSLTMVIYI